MLNFHSLSCEDRHKINIPDFDCSWSWEPERNCFVFFGPVALFHFMYTVFPLGVLYLEHLQLALDFVIIACSLDTIRPGLVQGCKAPNVVG